MDSYDLEVAFYRHLTSLSFDGRTVRPDEEFDPQITNDAMWRRGTVMLGKPDTIGFGNGVYARAEGIYQIDIYVARVVANALKTLKNIMDAHALHFFPQNGRGLTITENNTAAHILEHPSRPAFVREGEYIRERMDIYFYVEIPAT